MDSHNYPSDGVSAALEDVQIRMLQQNDAADRKDAMYPQNIEKCVPSSATSNTVDQDDGR